jgi:glycogen debranching enzyme
LKDSNVKDIIYSINKIEILSDNGRQIFNLLDEGLLYECFSNNESEFIFDCRKLFDMSNYGRYYDINVENGIIIVKYSKKKDNAESSMDEYDIFIAIKSDNNKIKKIDNWFKPSYIFDINRSDISERFIFNGFSLKTKRASIAYSLSKDEAIKKANWLYDMNPVSKTLKVKRKSDSLQINQAYTLSLNALRNLSKIQLKGIYAGIPWFMQFWTRDSALSSNALFRIDPDLSKDILLNYLSNIRKDGLISNRFPFSELDSIDSVGLVFFSISNNLDRFNNDELKFIYTNLRKAIDSLMVNHFKNFVLNKDRETWMDTDSRSGSRIEIQALLLNMLSLGKILAAKFGDKINNKFYMKKEKDFALKVRKNFYKRANLLDGVNDNTIRPNVFLAYHFYPQLLANKEWERVFNKHLKMLFLGWGGLSTIDLKDQRFINTHSGMNNKSYHLGDSWYYLNNLVAKCLWKVNRNLFSDYIKRIINASTYEILDMGIFGYHAEISSAFKQESNGCLAQAWSSALYIEMIDEIYV